MVRSLRIEKANGVYHVINRGNYWRDLFISQGALSAFEPTIRITDPCQGKCP